MDSSDEDTLIIAAASLVVQNIEESRKRKRSSRCRVGPFLQKRRKHGRFTTNFNHLRNNDKAFYENFHIKVEEFDDLFKRVEPFLIPKVRSRPNDEITPLEKFTVVLEYFASGTIQRHLASIYLISKQHFGTIIDEVCSAICKALKDEVPKLTKENFLEVSNDFNAIWNFPNCLGAIDGKHVALKCPVDSGSIFYNYKTFHSIVLMAVADANYRFIYFDIGAHESESDAAVFGVSKFGSAVLNDNMPFPDDGSIGNKKLPFYFIGDDAFPLHKRILKPFVPRKPQILTDDERIFNYRLSRARRVVENAFGILCAKWLCLKRTMFCGPDRAQKIVAACCYLHNTMTKSHKKSYIPPNYVDYYENGILVQGMWRKNIIVDSMFSSKITMNAGRSTNVGKFTRDSIKDYVNSDVGSLEWQRQSVFLD